MNVQFTQDQVEEIIKCSKSPIYFIETYVKYDDPITRTTPIALYDKQKELINVYHNNQRIIVNGARQVGKKICTEAYILWYILYNANRTVACVDIGAKETLHRIVDMFDNLPESLKIKVKKRNKNTFELDNGSTLFTTNYSPAYPMRGRAISLAYLKDFSYVKKDKQLDFMKSIYPVLVSLPFTKLIITSQKLQNSEDNLFTKLYDDAKKGINEFVPIDLRWNTRPRKDNFKDDMISLIGLDCWMDEYDCGIEL